MEILRKNEKWSMNHYCKGISKDARGCMALLEIEAVDIYLSYQHNNDKLDKKCNCVNGSYAFKCPCCGRETFIDEKDIPKNIKKAILKIELANSMKLKYMRELGYR